MERCKDGIKVEKQEAPEDCIISIHLTLFLPTYAELYYIIRVLRMLGKHYDINHMKTLLLQFQLLTILWQMLGKWCNTLVLVVHGYLVIVVKTTCFFTFMSSPHLSNFAEMFQSSYDIKVLGHFCGQRSAGKLLCFLHTGVFEVQPFHVTYYSQCKVMHNELTYQPHWQSPSPPPQKSQLQ